MSSQQPQSDDVDMANQADPASAPVTISVSHLSSEVNSASIVSFAPA
jgi:hypothetical protein